MLSWIEDDWPHRATFLKDRSACNAGINGRIPRAESYTQGKNTEIMSNPTALGWDEGMEIRGREQGLLPPKGLRSLYRRLLFLQDGHPSSGGLDDFVAIRDFFQRPIPDITGKKEDPLLPSPLEIHILEVEIVCDPF
jgi:hypothetical protein